jgi:hypothetical protein
MKKYIGNVIVSSPNYKVDNCFNKCLSLSNIDKTLPTLIIGLQNAKKEINDFNILNKKYDNDMLWWTFSKTERRSDHDKDIIDFHNYCISNIVNNIKYYYINYVNLSYSKAKKCLNFIHDNKKKYYYVDNNKFIFFYDCEMDGKVKNIYGFSLNTCAFFGIAKNKVLSLIENNQNNKKIKNFYKIPNNIRRLINDDIPSEIILLEYF